MNEPILPIKTIGEDNWVVKLTNFLEEYDVEVEGLNSTTDKFELPDEMHMYLKSFGGIDSSDFMYHLYKPNNFIKLIDADWSFIKKSFTSEDLSKYIVFSESPGNDPVCLNKEDGTIHFFSHDPVKSAKVFESFNQYLIYEIIEIQKLMGDIDLSKEDEIEFHKKNLGGKDIDYNFRYVKFC